MQIRLRQTVSSYVTQAGTPLLAEVIAPVEVQGNYLLPLRTELLGVVREARRVGLGFSRETALLDLEFNQIKLPGQPEQPLSGLVIRVDDARERVDGQGRIRGIRATETFANTVAGFAISAAAFDPMALIFALSSSLSIFRIPDSSVILPAGTELKFKLTADLVVSAAAPSPYPDLTVTGEQRTELEALVRDLPFRTTTQNNGTPSDLTSLLYLGSQEAIERAFLAAGWVRSDRLDGRSTYGVMRSVVENQGYRAAPMSVLVLNQKEPELAFAKTLNTFFSRHHLRIYGQPRQFNGQGVFTSTATYDSGIGFSVAGKTFIHLINEHIDEERTKVLHDLLLTGCVDEVGYIERPWVPRDAKNATGDTLRTDGRLAVLKLNECTKANRADEEAFPRQRQQVRQSAYLRPIRAAFLTLRNDFTRGNLIYQGFQGTRMGLGLMRKPAAEVTGTPRSFNYGGQEFLIVEGAKPVRNKLVPADAGARLERERELRRPRSYVSHLSFSLNGGLSGYGNTEFSRQGFTIVATTPSGSVVRDPLNFTALFERGWTLSPRVTLDATKYVAHEFGYSRTATNFRLLGMDGLGLAQSDMRSKAAIRRFTYNTLVYLRPNGKRFRPYVAAGPAFQLVHLLDAKPEKSGLLRFVARDVTLFLTAYDFGSKPALEGGGVFQFGLDYGAGAKYHVTPRFFIRGDFRETVSGQPDLWKSTPGALQQQTNSDTVRLEYSPLVKSGLMRHQLATFGIGLSF